MLILHFAFRGPS